MNQTFNSPDQYLQQFFCSCATVMFLTEGTAPAKARVLWNRDMTAIKRREYFFKCILCLTVYGGKAEAVQFAVGLRLFYSALSQQYLAVCHSSLSSHPLIFVLNNSVLK